MTQNKKLKGLFLDDERNPSDVTWISYPTDISWTVVRTYKEFCNTLEDGYDVYSFDHDIQDFHSVKKGDIRGQSAYGAVYYEKDMSVEFTGLHCLRELIEFKQVCTGFHKVKDVWFHTKNPIGLNNMKTEWDSSL